MRILVRSAVLPALLVLSACAPSTVNLAAPQTVVLRQDNELPKQPLSCLVQVREVADERTDRSNLGRTGLSTFVIEDGAAWLSHGLRALDKASYRFRHSTDKLEAAGLRHLEARIALKGLYVQSITTSRSAQVIATVQLADASGVWQAPQVLRGSDTGINWVNGNAEISGAFDLALERLLTQLDERFRKACTS